MFGTINFIKEKNYFFNCSVLIATKVMNRNNTRIQSILSNSELECINCILDNLFKKIELFLLEVNS